MRKTLEGGCHCGAVRFRFKVSEPASVLSCNCSICSMTGYLHLYVSSADLSFLRGEDHLQAYRFNTGAAEHLFCKTCGVKPLYHPRSHPGMWSVNLNCVDGGPAALDHTVTLYDGRDYDANVGQLEKHGEG